MIGSFRSLHGHSRGWNGIVQRAILGGLKAAVGSPTMAISQVPAVLGVHERLQQHQQQQQHQPQRQQRRTMAGYQKGGFRPKRRPDKNYRPLQIPKKRIRVAAPGNPQTFVEVNPQTGAITDLEGAFGSLGAEVIESIRNERERKRQQYKLGGNLQRDEAEESLRLLDYYIADEGSLEDRVGERRALSIDYPSQAGRDKFVKELDDFVANQTLADMDLDPDSIYKQHPLKADYRSGDFGHDADDMETMDQAEDDPELMFDPNQLAYGEWSELLITVDRTVKLWRGGRLESYRALVVGGNLNGCTLHVTSLERRARAPCWSHYVACCSSLVPMKQCRALPVPVQLIRFSLTRHCAFLLVWWQINNDYNARWWFRYW